MQSICGWSYISDFIRLSCDVYHHRMLPINLSYTSMVLASYLNVWMILYISLHDYVVSLKLKSLMSYNFYCATLVNRVSQI